MSKPLKIEDALTHHGVKGMKWGRRKEESSSSGGSSKPKPHVDAVQAHAVKKVLEKHGTHALSNQELQLYANRIQLEQRIAQLHSQPKAKTREAAGQKFVKDLLSSVAKQQVSKIANNEADKLIEAILKKK